LPHSPELKEGIEASFDKRDGADRRHLAQDMAAFVTDQDYNTTGGRELT